MGKLEFSFAASMKEIDANSWDNLAARYGSPFLSWGFLALLEASLSICPDTGWSPCHILARRSGKLVAAAPFYLRSHSMGDFVFDFSVAQYAQTIGARYYPKLVGIIPLTPVPAWRVMTAEGEDDIARSVLEFASSFARRLDSGGIHFLWVDPDFEPVVRFGGHAEWRHQRYLWSDEGYGDFSGYLASFGKNMRRNISRERGSLAKSGIETRIIPPALATATQLRIMADFYERTNDKFYPWSAKYLTPSFFRMLPEFMGQGWLLSAAFEQGHDNPVALALLFEGNKTLYGRYWGCARNIDALHFELCYYRPIEFALSNGYRFFDPGMGGDHKARRGFRSGLVSSFHDVFDARVSAALLAALPEANDAEAAGVSALNTELPYKTAPLSHSILR